jgi:outer membrane protein TolC
MFSFPVIGLMVSCVGAPVAGEREAQSRVAAEGRVFSAAAPGLPAVDGGGDLPAYTRYALWKNPAVRAAYLRWQSAVAGSTVARSQPDPKLTLQFDYDGGLTSLMPGAMFDYMARGKREAMGTSALAGGEMAYRDYVAVQLSVAGDLRNAWIDLASAEESLSLQRELLAAYEQAAATASDDYVTGRGDGLTEIVKLRNEAARQRSQLDIAVERRNASRAAFKAVLGLRPGEADPVWPTARLSASVLPDEDSLWKAVEASNPDLGKLRAAVTQAVADMDVARASRSPDYSLGAMADVKMNPIVWRPQASMTLPIWKDKLAAEIAVADARAGAARADVDARRITLAAELAQAFYEVRAADSTLRFLDGAALPSLETAQAMAAAGLQSGTGMASAPAMARVEIAMARLERVEALRMRERAATKLLLLGAGLAPDAGK